MSSNEVNQIGKKWLTVNECAVYLGLTARAVYNHIHRGTLPYQKLGARVLFDPEEIDAAIRHRSKRSRRLN